MLSNEYGIGTKLHPFVPCIIYISGLKTTVLLPELQIELPGGT